MQEMELADFALMIGFKGLSTVHEMSAVVFVSSRLYPANAQI